MLINAGSIAFVIIALAAPGCKKADAWGLVTGCYANASSLGVYAYLCLQGSLVHSSNKGEACKAAFETPNVNQYEFQIPCLPNALQERHAHPAPLC